MILHILSHKIKFDSMAHKCREVLFSSAFPMLHMWPASGHIHKTWQGRTLMSFSATVVKISFCHISIFILSLSLFPLTPGVRMYPGAAAVSSQEEGFVLLSLPRPAADPEEVGPEEALPCSHRLAGGTNHRHGWYGVYSSSLKGKAWSCNMATVDYRTMFAVIFHSDDKNSEECQPGNETKVNKTLAHFSSRVCRTTGSRSCTSCTSLSWLLFLTSIPSEH